MTRIRHILAGCLVCLCAAPGAAAPECKAQQGWNAEVHSHQDLGHGRVSWTWSWSAEGVADDLHVVDCAQADGLRLRARAERMTNPLPYDRRDTAQRVITRSANAPHFFRLANLADELTKAQVPTVRFQPDSEPCACAAYYPGAFGLGKNDTRDP